MSQNSITEQDALRNLEEFRQLGKEVLKERESIKEILISSGLTESGAELDLLLLKKQMDSMGAEVHRVVGRKIKNGTFAAQIAYDVPNFLTALYCGPAIVIGMPVLIRYPSSQLDLGKIWNEKISELGIDSIKIDLDKSGTDFGDYCLKHPDIRHFLIAGGQRIVDFYDRKEVMEQLDTLILFGPDLPKAIFMKSIDKNKLHDVVKTTVNTAFFNSGQICALEKELLVDNEIYDDVKKMLITEVSSLSYGLHTDHVGPIRNEPTFERLKEIIEHIKNNPQTYRILYGGDIRGNVVTPTLVEIIGNMDNELDFFGPLLFLKRVHGKEHAIEEVKKDIFHGGHVFVHGASQDVFEIEGLLKERVGNVKLNANIMNESIDWPYGAFGKYSFILKTREGAEIQTRKGKVYLSHVLSY